MAKADQYQHLKLGPKRYFISQRQISVAGTLLSHPGTHFYFWFSFSRFPIWFQLKWGHFGPNGQKLHEYWKINILGAKIVKNMGRKANFLGTGGDPPVPQRGENLLFQILDWKFSTQHRRDGFHFLISLWQMGPCCSGDYRKMIPLPSPVPIILKI